jgi:hypothetical protein
MLSVVRLNVIMLSVVAQRLFQVYPEKRQCHKITAAVPPKHCSSASKALQHCTKALQQCRKITAAVPQKHTKALQQCTKAVQQCHQSSAAVPPKQCSSATKALQRCHKTTAAVPKNLYNHWFSPDTLKRIELIPEVEPARADDRYVNSESFRSGPTTTSTSIEAESEVELRPRPHFLEEDRVSKFKKPFLFLRR